MDKQSLNELIDEALDMDITELLAEAQQPVELPESLKSQMREQVMSGIKADKEEALASAEATSSSDEIITVRKEEGQWIEAAPGAEIKILNQEPDGVLSYLVKLQPGFYMEGHDHPFDEECLMLEGELSFGDLVLRAGDFHLARKGTVHGAIQSKHGALAYIRGPLPVAA